MIQLRTQLRRPRVLGGVSVVVMVLGVLILLAAGLPAPDPAALAMTSAPPHGSIPHAMEHATPALASPPSS